MELPATYKAAVYDAPGTISTKIMELPMPEPGEGEVLIKLFVIPQNSARCTRIRGAPWADSETPGRTRVSATRTWVS